MPAASKIIKILHLKRHTRKALKRWKMENGKYKKSVQQCNNDNKIIHFHFFYMKRTYFAIAMDSDIRKSLSVQKITNAYVKEIRFAYNVTGSTYSKKFFLSYVYHKDIYKTLKGIGKIQFVSELAIQLNLQISKFYRSHYKEKN